MNQSTNKNQLQQGDVLLTKTTLQDQKVKEMSPNGDIFIIAKGEQTGHIHSVGLEAQVFSTDDGRLFIVNNTRGAITMNHDEHGPIKIDPGTWQVSRVREFDYLQYQERMIQD